MMAGVGFSLRSLAGGESYAANARLYGFAGVISSGPWLLSILTLLAAGVLGRDLVSDPGLVVRFQVSVTWLFAGSLLLAGPLQLMFTRFVADREYAGELDEIVSNLCGALVCTSASSAATACALGACFFGGFAQESCASRVLLGTGFVVLCDLWIVVGALVGLRDHLAVLRVFALGYAITLGGILLLARFEPLGLLLGFVLGHAVLLYGSLFVLLRRMPGPVRVSFRFAGRGAMFLELGLVGLAYNLGIWVDKLLFWFEPSTSQRVLGPLRASELYDLPIFLGYLTIVPGMAVFLVRIETDFADSHRAFYAAVRDGASLRTIEALRDRMTDAARCGLEDIVRVQGLTWLGCVGLAPSVLDRFGISRLHLALFYFDSLGVALQVLLLAVTSLFFYLDLRRPVLCVTLLLLASNSTLTWLTQRLGPAYYGCGFAAAMALTSVVGLVMLSRAFTHLVRDTFMKQPVPV